jgi:hypothetical protein
LTEEPAIKAAGAARFGGDGSIFGNGRVCHNFYKADLLPAAAGHQFALTLAGSAAAI